jgi:16S rRNA (guanine(966)-N(2))-methyltransferase RsmD
MQVRIISGSLGGRRLNVPSTFSAKPMGERIRSSIFNSLGPLEDTYVLDLFSGSGVCGLEALSRGAASVTLIEKDLSVFKLLRKNLVALNLKPSTNLKLINSTAFSFLKSYAGPSFQIIIIDPPYNLLRSKDPKNKTEQNGSVNFPFHETINLAATKLNSNGSLILSWPESEELPEIIGLKLTKFKGYAGAQIGWYQAAESTADSLE